MFRKWLRHWLFEGLPPTSTLTVRPDDILVINFDRPLSSETVRRVKEVWEHELKKGVRIVVTEGGCNLEVLKQEDRNANVANHYNIS